MFTWIKTLLTPVPDLPNRHFYDRIERRMQAKSHPTVNDAMRAARWSGNTVYHKAFGTAHEWPLSNKVAQIHEVAHLAGCIGHTMQHEAFEDIFQRGLTIGSGIRRGTPEEQADIMHKIGVQFQLHVRDTQSWDEWRHDAASKISAAVYMAAGMYLRDKIDAFAHAELLGLPKTEYGRQKQFCTDYAMQDSVLAAQPYTHIWDDAKNDTWPDIGAAPYALITLTREEWRAVTAVALGLREPEQTQFPNRLSAVKEALIHTGMFYDARHQFEEAKKNHALHHPAGEPFDDEQFWRARTKRNTAGENALRRF